MKQQVIDVLSQNIYEHFDEVFIDILIEAIENAPADLTESLKIKMRDGREAIRLILAQEGGQEE